MTISIEFPLTLPSVANLREHWAAKAKRVKAQRTATRWALVSGLVSARVDPTSRTPVVAEFTRIAPRKLDDDNLQSAFKAVRDEVAAYFGVDDADPRIRFTYAQAKGEAAVRIELRVEAMPTDAGSWLIAHGGWRMTEAELKAIEDEAIPKRHKVLALVAEVRRLRRVIVVMHTHIRPADAPEVREVLREIGHEVPE